MRRLQLTVNNLWGLAFCRCLFVMSRTGSEFGDPLPRVVPPPGPGLCSQVRGTGPLGPPVS